MFKQVDLSVNWLEYFYYIGIFSLFIEINTVQCIMS